MHGSPEPLGVSLSEGGVNVAVFSANATAIAFCTFDADGETQTRRWVLPGKTGSVFHGFIPGVGAGANYALRASGPFAPEAGHRFAPETVLIDPYALALGPHGLAVVVAPTEAAAILSIPWDQTVIYELHVRGFTKTHPGIPEAIRGTFAGLAHPVAIAHLQRLGVTSVELMPVATWTDERHLAPLGLSNYWGYNPVAFMVPDARLAPGGWDEVRMAVAALAEAGIETLLDVVFNHTGEGDALGPTLSWRGLDNASYYRLTPDNPAAYVNDAGTGNVLALDRPFPLRLVMDCLRTWRRLGGVNGFRFDLATVLGRRAEGFDPAAPLLAAIGQDPELRGLKLIAEPWDIGPGGYQLGRFPATWGEWNDRFRDDLRGFWAGDAVSLGTLAARLAGSQDLLPGHPVSRSVNFIVAHDGFTLADLTSYDAKQNLANGELGRDGSGHERSWNHGVNGPSSDPAVEEARRRDQRALIASLIVARGTPMLAMGMEQGHSQGGNNNAYAQDNAISWLNWAAADPQLVAFTQRLIAIRRDHIALRADQALTGTTAGDEVHADVAWRTADGDTLTAAQWDDALGESLVMALAARDPVGLDRVVVILHRGPDPTQATLPEPEDGYAWTLLADSADPDRTGPREDDVVWAQPRSVQILAQIAAPKRRPRGADDTVVARLAAAAGIAPQWWGVDGQGHAVSRQTQSVLLTAMGLPAETTHQALESLSRLADEHDRRALPFITTLSGAGDILVRSDPAVPALRCPVILQGEDGTTHRLRFKPAEGALHLCRAGR